MAKTGLEFKRSQRLTHDREYQAVYGGRVSRAAGPLAVYGRPNGLPRTRLGLSVGRRVGPAVKRNRIKRLLREAFRLSQHELPVGARGGYDLVVNVRPHEELALSDYQRILLDLAGKIDREWRRRGDNGA